MSDKPDQTPPKQATYNGHPMPGFILPQEQIQQVSTPTAKMINDKPEQQSHKNIILQSRFNLLLWRRIPVPLWVIIVFVLFGLALFINMVTVASINTQPLATSDTTPTSVPVTSTTVPILRPMPTLIPTPTQLPTPTQPPQWTTIYTFTGNGTKKTTVFSVPDNWELIWSCNPSSSYGGEYNVIVDVKGSDGSDVDPGAVNTICKAGNTGDSTQEYQGGDVYFDVSSEGAWTIQVQVLE